MPRPPFQHCLDTWEALPASSQENGLFVDRLDRVLADVRSVVLSELARSSHTEVALHSEKDSGSQLFKEPHWTEIGTNGHGALQSDACEADDENCAPALQLLKQMDAADKKLVQFVKPQQQDSGDKAAPVSSGSAIQSRSGSFPKRSQAVESLKNAYQELMLRRGSSNVHLSAALRKIDHRTTAKIRIALHAFIHTCTITPLLALDSVMAIVIILNAMAIGLSTDTADWGGWIVVDLIFCLVFLIEFIFKLCYMGFKGYFGGKQEIGWHVFETVLLAFSIADIVLSFSGDHMFAGTALFRVFRLLRLAKILRVSRLQLVSDLAMMISGTIGGLRTLCWSGIVISLPLYVVALVLRETLGTETETGNGAESFSTLPKAFFTIYRCMVAGDCSNEDGRPIFVLVTAEYGWAYGVIYSMTVLFMTFGLFNVIVAIYVENTLSAAKCSELKLKEGRLRNAEIFKEKSLELAMLIYSFKAGIDVATILAEAPDFASICDIEVSQSEFTEICEDSAFCDLLCELDIASENQKDLFDTLDSDRGGSLDVHEIIDGISKLRGDARKSDIVSVLLSVRHVTEVLNQTTQVLNSNNEMLDHLKATIAPLIEKPGS